MKKTLRFVALAMVAVVLCISLASCGGPNSDPDKAVESLRENGIVWAIKDTVGVPATLKAIGANGVTAVVTGTGKIDDKFAHITIIYFDSAENATASFEAVEKYSADDKDDAKDNWVFKKSGKMIYYGTTEAVKAAK